MRTRPPRPRLNLPAVLTIAVQMTRPHSRAQAALAHGTRAAPGHAATTFPLVAGVSMLLGNLLAWIHIPRLAACRFLRFHVPRVQAHHREGEGHLDVRLLRAPLHDLYRHAVFDESCSLVQKRCVRHVKARGPVKLRVDLRPWVATCDGCALGFEGAAASPMHHGPSLPTMSQRHAFLCETSARHQGRAMKSSELRSSILRPAYLQSTVAFNIRLYCKGACVTLRPVYPIGPTAALLYPS